ncbi:MAG: glycoside hydrolase family 2, partial [Clostridiales bacterium]|nr:glycoside hydrolase family 2 [Clostridiales bacterium]
MKVISLNGQWNLKFFPQEEGSRCEAIEIPCTVPGNVELDLSAAGILPKDLFMGDNIRQAEKYETYEWWYSRDFDAPVTNEKIFLHFKGVDCIAEYFLNDELIGSSKNALIPIEFDITEKIRDVNNLKVRIKSALLEAYDIDYETYVLKNGWGLNPESIYIRKPPHCYGWDIMPRAVSAGIWKDAELHLVSDMEIEDISYTVKSLSEQEAAVKFVYELRLPVNSVGKVKLQVEGKCGGSSFSFEVTPKFKAGYVDITIKNPKLWWPYGYGEPNVYNLTAKIIYGDTISTVNTFTLGLRTVELRRTDVTDGINGCFEFIVNGVKVICKGSNWVPMDAYHSRDKERYAKALELFSDIGCNIIRLWGGNVYEQEEFYNYCDRHGIMVWQDFTMACHAYPQDESFLEVIKDEAKVIIKSLRNHPCIILWSGDNENDTLLLACGTNPNKNR